VRSEWRTRYPFREENVKATSPDCTGIGNPLYCDQPKPGYSPWRHRQEEVFSSSGDLTRTGRNRDSQQQLAAVLRFVAQSLFSTIFPSDCLLCNSPLANISRLPVCTECLETIQPLSGPLCEWCGDRLTPYAQEGQICIRCEEKGPRFEHAAAYGEYEDALRSLIHLLKYQRIRPAARPLGKALAQTIRLLLSEFPGPFLICPVPLHRQRYSTRGFNQAEEVLRVALRELRDLPVEFAPKLLVRTRFTESQTGFTREQRRANLRGAFAVSRPARVLGRNIILVDDVLTTGATADECSRILLRAGAKQVLVATVARAVSLDGVAPATKTCSVQETSAREAVSV
jgi:ComF family protein